MNEALGNLYALTGKHEYLDLAGRFEKTMFLDPLAEHRDELKGLHANTHIPQVIGAARRYELTGDDHYHQIAAFFFRTVTTRPNLLHGWHQLRRALANSPREISPRNWEKPREECCCSYNMLKLARHVYAWTADPRVLDYYERTLFNSRLGTQNTEDGTMSYFLPLGSGFWKYFNTPYDSFWCCTGTGIEEYAKTADTIYFHDDHRIFVNLFIASEVTWPEKGIRPRATDQLPGGGRDCPGGPHRTTGRYGPRYSNPKLGHERRRG